MWTFRIDNYKFSNVPPISRSKAPIKPHYFIIIILIQNIVLFFCLYRSRFEMGHFNSFKGLNHIFTFGTFLVPYPCSLLAFFASIKAFEPGLHPFSKIL